MSVERIDPTRPLINARGARLNVIQTFSPGTHPHTGQVLHRHVVQEVDAPAVVYTVDSVGTPIDVGRFPPEEYEARQYQPPMKGYANFSVVNGALSLRGKPHHTLEGAKAAAACYGSDVSQYRLVPVMPGDPDANPTRVAYCVLRVRGDRLDFIHAYTNPTDATLRSIGERGSVVATMTWDDR